MFLPPYVRAIKMVLRKAFRMALNIESSIQWQPYLPYLRRLHLLQVEIKTIMIVLKKKKTLFVNKIYYSSYFFAIPLTVLEKYLLQPMIGYLISLNPCKEYKRSKVSMYAFSQKYFAKTVLFTDINLLAWMKYFRNAYALLKNIRKG